DGRLTYSTPTLVCILAYATAAIACNVAHGLRQTHSRETAGVQPADLTSACGGGEACGRTLETGNGATRHHWLAIQTAVVGHRPETRGQADHRLGAAEHQEAVALRHVGDPFEHVDLGGLVEVDQHVAAKHHVEASER